MRSYIHTLGFNRFFFVNFYLCDCAQNQLFYKQCHTGSVNVTKSLQVMITGIYIPDGRP